MAVAAISAVKCKCAYVQCQLHMGHVNAGVNYCDYRCRFKRC